MEIQILKDDPAYPFLDTLQHRREKGLDVITIADTFHNLLSTLHRTSAKNRPLLNGNSRKIVIEHLGVTKGMLSQYMTIAKNIQSQQVKQEIKNHQIWLIDAYYLSKVRGKNQEETEKLQLKAIQKIVENRKENIKSMQISKEKKI